MSSPKARLKDAERALAREPDNLVLRLKLAAALREVGRLPEAVDLYRSVAVAYQREGRLAQAIAVCRSILELAPDDLGTRVLSGELEEARTGGPGEEPTRLAADAPPAPRIAAGTGSRRLPEVVEVGPDEYDFDDESKTNP